MIQRQRIHRHGMQLLAWLRVGGIVFGGIALVAVSSVSAPAAPKTITSLAELHSLTNQQASKSIPVVLEATVTNHVKGTSGIFLQDGALAIYADAPERFIQNPATRSRFAERQVLGFAPTSWQRVSPSSATGQCQRLYPPATDNSFATILIACA
jgi:hypothetical protein